MRVGLVIYGSLDTLSGGYLYDRILVEYLRREGDEVIVYALPVRGYPGRLAQNVVNRLASPAALDLDLVLQDELCHPSLISWNRMVRKSSKIPIISIVHHLLSSEPGQRSWISAFYRRVELAYLRGVDGFIFNSETTRRVVEGAIGPSGCAIVAQPGADRLDPRIDEGEITERASSGGPLRILFLGNVIPRKGLDVLIDALSRLGSLDWQLTVIGSLEMDREYAGKVQAAAREGIQSGQSRFCGPLVDDRLAVEMRSHHLMALPSFYEGYGIAYLEAMGFGMPVIGASAGAAPEIITPGKTGFLVPPGDPQALAEAISGLIADRSRLAEMSLAARRQYLASPRWDESAEKIRTFLRNVIHRRG